MNTPGFQVVTITVLVVDDDADVRRIIVRELEQAGFRVLTAANGDDALAVLARSEVEVQLVLCDLLMPGVDGYQLAARLENEAMLRRRGMIDPAQAISHHFLI